MSFRLRAFVLAASLILISQAFGQESEIKPGSLPAAEAARIIQRVTENESAFRSALTNYVFNRDATIQTIGLGNYVNGEYKRVSFMALTESGERFEKILRFPVPNLKGIDLTPEDLEDLGGVNPFALEPSQVANYNFNYVGTAKIDELNLLVFDVTPKVIPDPKKSKLRLFNGRIWVDKDDLMIVKSKGKAVPETKNNKYPVVETWRENIDGKYWFPSYIYADDELVFDNGQVIRLRMKVKYENYRQGRSDVRILDDEPTAKPEASPSPTPPAKKP